MLGVSEPVRRGNQTSLLLEDIVELLPLVKDVLQPGRIPPLLSDLLLLGARTNDHVTVCKSKLALPFRAIAHVCCVVRALEDLCLTALSSCGL